MSNQEEILTASKDRIAALVKLMAWRRPGQWWLDYWRKYASLDFNELALYPQ